jgi:Flp pilus assembly protein TadD
MTKAVAVTKGASHDTFKGIFKNERAQRVHARVRDELVSMGQGSGSTVATPDGDDVVIEAERCVIAGRYADAQALARSLTAREPANADAWAALGLAQAMWNQFDDAVTAYRTAIRHRPNDARFYADLGWVLGMLERWEEARDALERAVHLDAGPQYSRMRLAFVLASQGDTARAGTMMEACVQEVPDNQDFKNMLAATRIEHGMREWWIETGEGARYCTSRAQLEQARAGLEGAKQVGSSDEAIKKEIVDQEGLLAQLDERVLEASWAAIIFFGLCYILPGIAWYYVHKRPRYLVNHDYMLESTGKPLRASLRLSRLLGRGYSAIGKSHDSPWIWLAIMMPIQAVLLPVLFFLALKENYLDVDVVGQGATPPN